MSAPPAAAGPPNPRSPPGSAGHRRGRPHPHRAPPHPCPHADRLRQATRRPLQQRTSATNLADVTRHFGTIDIGEILARITRGLLRAAALEARLVSRPVREPATLATLTAPSPRQPRAAQPEDGSAAAAEPRIARLPTPGDIAAEIRRRPAGAVLADICRDLGIVPSNPLWRELSAAIISNGGNLATLFKDIFDRLGLSLIRPPAAAQPAGPAPILPSTVRPGTGPP